MARATQQQLERYLKHHWRRTALLVDVERAVVEQQGLTAARLGYERMAEVSLSTTGAELYQWWKRKSDHERMGSEI
jgi:hypothetical protein